MKLQRLQEIETRLKVLKVCSESIYVRVSMGWSFKLHIKQESWKFKSKHHFFEMNSSCYNIGNGYCNFERCCKNEIIYILKTKGLPSYVCIVN